MTSEFTLGNLVTLEKDHGSYPGLPPLWVQVRTGPTNDAIFARVYGDSPEETRANGARVVQALKGYEVMKDALHQISLCANSSLGSKDECGRIARAALGKL